MKEIKMEQFLRDNPHILEGINSTLLISEINNIRFEDSLTAYNYYEGGADKYTVTNIVYSYHTIDTHIMRVLEIMLASMLTSAYLEKLEGKASGDGDILIQERRPLEITETSIGWRGRIVRIPRDAELVEVGV